MKEVDSRCALGAHCLNINSQLSLLKLDEYVLGLNYLWIFSYLIFIIRNYQKIVNLWIWNSAKILATSDVAEKLYLNRNKLHCERKMMINVIR